MDNNEIIEVKSSAVEGKECSGTAEVNLPETEKVETNSEEFRQMIVDQVPEDVASEVSGVLTSGRRKLKVWEFLVAVVVIVVMVAMFAHFVPDGKATIVQDKVSADGLMQDSSTFLYDIFASAENDYEAGNYNAFVKKMEPAVAGFFKSENLTRREVRQNEQVLYKYFSARKLAESNPARDAKARVQLECLTACDPDCYQWKAFYLAAEYDCLASAIPNEFKIVKVKKNGEKTYQTLRNYNADGSENLVPVQDLKVDLRKEIVNLNKMIDRFREDANKALALQVMRCRIWINLWLLETQTHGWKNYYLADGVQERENACRELKAITDRHLDYGDNVCLNLQKFVVEELLAHWPVVRKVRFNGQDYWRKAGVEAELERINDALSKNKH